MLSRNSFAASFKTTCIAAGIAAIGLTSGGCGTDAQGVQDLTNAVNLATGALNVANAVSGRGAPPPPAAAAAAAAATAGGYRNAYAQGQLPTAGTNAIGAGTANGYSQRQAFEDCEIVYQQANRPELAAQCATRATNMNSLTPMIMPKP